MPATLPRERYIKFGRKGQRPRIYAEGRYLARDGFAPGTRIEVELRAGEVRIRASERGANTVMYRGDIPVIDVTGRELSLALGNVERLKLEVRRGEIRVLPFDPSRVRRERVRKRDAVSLYAGGGGFDVALQRAGFRTVLAVEHNENYAAILDENHDIRSLANLCISEVPLETLLSLRNRVGLLVAGQPCEPFSPLRQRPPEELGLPPEAHALGDLTLQTFLKIYLVNPYAAVIEEVPAFLKSGSGYALQGALRRIGYTVAARVLNPADFGSLAARERAVIVATTDPEIRWPAPSLRLRALAEILTPPEALPADVWWRVSEKPWACLGAEESRQTNRRFRPRVVDGSTPAVPTIPKGYWKQKSENVQVAHPSDPDLRRWLTIEEVKLLHGFGREYRLGGVKKHAGEILGQSIVVDLFAQVIESVTQGWPA